MLTSTKTWINKFKSLIKRIVSEKYIHLLRETPQKVRIKIFYGLRYYFLGFYPAKLDSPNRFHTYLKNKPALIKEHELKKIAAFIAIIDDQKYYEKLLKEFVPQWNVDIQESQFVGCGSGISNLNIFRKVTIENRIYFEKVYFSSYQHVQTVQWFQNHIYGLIKGKINVPGLQKTYSGELLTIVYYEYFELDVWEEIIESKSIQFTKDLYRISCEHETYLTKLDLPEPIEDFRNHFQYQRKRHLSNVKLRKRGINIQALEKSMDQSKCILMHGDIKQSNYFKNSTLLDWDYFGIYPIGLEPAFIYFRLLPEKNEKNDVISWLKKYYSDVVSEKDWQDFERNFTYFLFILSVNYFDRGQYKHIEKQLIKKLKHYGIANKVFC